MKIIEMNRTILAIFVVFVFNCNNNAEYRKVTLDLEKSQYFPFQNVVIHARSSYFVYEDYRDSVFFEFSVEGNKELIKLYDGESDQRGNEIARLFVRNSIISLGNNEEYLKIILKSGDTLIYIINDEIRDNPSFSFYNKLSKIKRNWYIAH
jgi:hypothetical protein